MNFRHLAAKEGHAMSEEDTEVTAQDILRGMLLKHASFGGTQHTIQHVMRCALALAAYDHWQKEDNPWLAIKSAANIVNGRPV